MDDQISDNSNSFLPDYESTLAEVFSLLEAARRAAARSVNAVMTAAYWRIGQRLVEVEQAGQKEQSMERSLFRVSRWT